MSESKAKKIARRTLSGGTLVAALAGLLWWTNQSPTGMPLFVATAIVSIGAAIEMSRLGTFALFDAFPAFLSAAVFALAFADASNEERLVSRDYAALGATPVSLGLETLRAYTATLVAGAAAFAVLAVARRHVRSTSLARLSTYFVVGAALMWALRDFHSQPSSLWPALGALAALTLVLTAILWRSRESRRRIVAVALLGALFAVPLPLVWTFWSTAGGTGDIAHRTQAVVALLVLAKIGDSAGYYVGNALGKSHPFPKISPGKTTAGCVASFASAIALAGALFAFDVLPDARFGLAGALVIGALINVASQAGDLLESFVKRRAGVKDSSQVFGPSGGVLDQVDSLLLAVPVAALAWPIIFAP